MMTQLDVLDVVRNGAEALSLVHHLVGRHEYELGVLVDKLFDQPGAGDAVDLTYRGSSALLIISLRADSDYLLEVQTVAAL